MILVETSGASHGKTLCKIEVAVLVFRFKGITERTITSQPFIVHASKHRYLSINIVVHAHDSLAKVEPV